MSEIINIEKNNLIFENEIKRDKLSSNLTTLKFGNTNIKNNKENDITNFNRKYVSGNINLNKKNVFIDLFFFNEVFLLYYKRKTS